MSQPLKALVRLALVASLAALGCGGDDGDGGDPIDATSGGDPTASFTITPDCTTSSSTEITFTSTSTDPESQALTCSWTFGSGNPGSSTQCTVEGVTFPNAAPYTITLEVEDTDGKTDTASDTIAPCG